uniref:Uncharacterized protein n=1 Tax=Neovison vison TaxID=452646 RepID=A0A8C7BIV2_NEOVI
MHAGVWKKSNFQSTPAVLHFRGDSVMVPLKVDAAFLPFKQYLSSLLFAVLITDGLLGIIFFRGSFLYTSYSVL